MEQILRVQKLHEDGTVRAVRIHGDPHPDGDSTAVLLVKDPIGVEVGDLVTVSAAVGVAPGVAAMGCVPPLVLFYIGYYFGAVFRHPILGGALGALAGIAVTVVCGTRAARKRGVVYTVTGLAGTQEEG